MKKFRGNYKKCIEEIKNQCLNDIERSKKIVKENARDFLRAGRILQAEIILDIIERL